MATDPKQVAESALDRMQSAGFDDCQVSVTFSQQDELNIAHNEASLLRSTENYDIALVAILDGRKASVALTDVNEDAIADELRGLLERVESAPQDEANAVSAGQTGHFEQGPLLSDLDILAQKAGELLEFRASHSPRVNIEEAAVAHRLVRFHEVSSQGTALSGTVGCFDLGVVCTASEKGKSSSINETEGSTNDLSAKSAAQWFAIGDMLEDTQRQIDTRSVDGRFVGDVILAPAAVSDLVNWLLEQLGPRALIAGTSVYKDRVGDQIAASALSLSSSFDAPGHLPFSADGFVAQPIQLIDKGELTTLLLDLYGSKKTRLPHTPSSSGWRIWPGNESKAALIASVGRGALVNRLAMGAPVANGDFSGVIKNSFIIEDGSIGGALSDTMVAGNMAKMLMDINGVSAEHIDYGGGDYPWLRIPGMHFS
jgi:PmbA protein